MPACFAASSFSVLALLALGVLGTMLVTNDPRTGVLDLALLLAAALLLPLYLWRVEQAASS
jgi:hypothetical protein